MRRNEKLYLLVSFMLGVMMLLISFSVGSCKVRPIWAAETYQQTKENSWRYENGTLKQNFARMAKSAGKVKKPANATASGIDVSHHQGRIDWEQVKAYSDSAADPKVDFVILRCGYGTNKEANDDKQWECNVSECERLGIPYGVYLYSYATTTEAAKSEAEHVLCLIQGRNLTYPIYDDMEDKEQKKLSVDQLAQIADTFFSTLEANGYTNVGVYANKDWFQNKLKHSMFDRFPRWIAQYTSQCDYDKNYHMWQYSEGGSIPGINGTVDLNYKIGDWTQGGYMPDVVLSKKSMTMSVGKNGFLSATDSIRKTYKLSTNWTSSNAEVATVDQTGKVTAKSAGKATITVTISNGKKASCNVTVNPQTNKITKIAKSGSYAVKINWSKISKITKYEVYMSEKKNSGYRKVKTVSAKTTSYTSGKLKKGKTYYFKVRSYRTVNKKNYYSAYSAIQSIKR